MTSPVPENKEAKQGNTIGQGNPEDVYAAINREDNPPINGFYEMIMDLTPERRAELRQVAARHGEEQQKETEAPKEAVRQSEPAQETLVAASTLFSEPEAEKAPDLSPRPYHRTPEMHLREGSLVANRAHDNIGYLKDITPYGATFQPLGLIGYQKEKALLYVSLRDAYERLYRYESLRREENVPWREHLNTCYDEFVMRYGNLNAGQNVKLVMMDAAGRDILSLERAEEGKFVKADIFEHPVSFSVETDIHAGSPEEALSASLNKYGGVNLEYMRTITDGTEEELLTALKDRIYFHYLRGTGLQLRLCKEEDYVRFDDITNLQLVTYSAKNMIYFT